MFICGFYLPEHDPDDGNDEPISVWLDDSGDYYVPLRGLSKLSCEYISRLEKHFKRAQEHSRSILKTLVPTGLPTGARPYCDAPTWVIEAALADTFVCNLAGKDSLEAELTLRKSEKSLKQKRQDEEKAFKLPEYVYLLNAGPYYKIGASRDVGGRIKQLSTLPPFDLELVCTIKTDDMFTLERDLHERFKDKHVNGEWFELDQDDVTYIRELADEQFTT